MIIWEDLEISDKIHVCESSSSSACYLSFIYSHQMLHCYEKGYYLPQMIQILISIRETEQKAKGLLSLHQLNMISSSSN